MTGLILAAISVAACDYTGWGCDGLERRDGVRIAGPKNTYAIHLVSEKAKSAGKAATYFTMTRPRRIWGFGQHAVTRFLGMEINDIPLSKIVVTDHTFKYADDGATAHLNFDGTAIDVTMFMKETSPLLWFRIRSANEQLRPLRKFVLSLRCVISGRCEECPAAGGYARYAVTAARTLDATPQPQMLSEKDRYLVLADRNLDGSRQGRGYGANVIRLPDFDLLERAELSLDNTLETSLKMSVRPDFKELEFAILQTQGPLSVEEAIRQGTIQ